MKLDICYLECVVLSITTTGDAVFYDRFNSITNALSLILGSATVYGVLKTNVDVTIFAPALVTIFSSINLVIGSNPQARVHHDLCKRFISIEKDISVNTNPNEDMLAKWIAERLDIESEEPPVLHVLNCICHNELARAMGHSSESFAKIAWYQRLLAPFIDFREHSIKVG
jgi:hypothetical protein